MTLSAAWKYTFHIHEHFIFFEPGTVEKFRYETAFETTC